MRGTGEVLLFNGRFQETRARRHAHPVVFPSTGHTSSAQNASHPRPQLSASPAWPQDPEARVLTKPRPHRRHRSHVHASRVAQPVVSHPCLQVALPCQELWHALHVVSTSNGTRRSATAQPRLGGVCGGGDGDGGSSARGISDCPTQQASAAAAVALADGHPKAP